jgi:hypothetical protein
MYNINQYSKTNVMHFLYSIRYEFMTSKCFEHYLFIFRKCCTNGTWYIVCVLCLLAATRVGVESIPLQPDIIRTQYTNYAEPPEDEQVVLETCRCH